MYIKEMKPIIQKAMQYNISNITTYDGYNGADILKFEILNNNELLTIRDYCRNLGFEVSTKLPVRKCGPYELYCVFEKNKDVYMLK